jgi:hypothetical protein
MPRDFKTADSGDAEMRPLDPPAAPSGEKKTVEELALELGYVDVMVPHPAKQLAERGMMVVGKDAGAGNRALYACARAREGWVIGTRMTAAEFKAAIDRAANMKIGTHEPVKG